MSSADLVARLLSVARSGAIVVDAAGHVTLLNDAARELLGLAPGDHTGRPLAAVLEPCPSLARLLDEALAAAAEGGSTADKAEAAVVVGGRERAVGFTVHAARDDQGRLLGALVLLRALSQIETSIEMTLARERLAAVGAMAATIAHEMRNPLAGIRLSATMLRRRIEASPQEADLIDAIIAEVRKLEETVNRCLTYLRPLALDLGEVSVNDTVREALALAEAALASAAAPIEVRLDLAEGLPPVTGDANRLREAVCNLVTNAIEAMRDRGGTLTLATGSSPGPGVTITVGDTGPGIAPDIMDSIFYPFFTTKPEGSGVGLATVQKIVTGHRGGIEVSSEPGRGATFRILLPAARGASGHTNPDPRRRLAS
ncbi:MAG TPA: ATP-binding protein [Thermodesulfobacteriota bacterium]